MSVSIFGINLQRGQRTQRPRLFSATASEQGTERQYNEDYVVAEDAAGIFAVADGMGGHLGGAEASAYVSAVIVGQLMEAETAPHFDLADAEATLQQAVAQAVDGMRELAELRPAMKNMGTTLVVGWLVNGEFYYGHAGDSRLYLFRRRRLRRLTKDHSFAQGLYDAGIIAEGECPKSPWRHLIDRSVGPSSENCHLDVATCRIERHDRLIFTTDGITDTLNDFAIEKAAGCARSPEELCEWLIAAAKESGARDDMSCVVVDCDYAP